MTKRNCRPPNRKPVPQRPVELHLGMTPERLRQASTALGCDPEDSTDDEKAALQEYIDGGGNVWAL